MEKKEIVMRINNKRIIPYVNNIHTLSFIGLAMSVILIFIPIGIIVERISPYILTGGIVLFLFLFFKLGHQHLEYDSDGEVINIRTKNVFWSKYLPNQIISMDFPKKKLVSYKVVNRFPKRTLELYVTSRRSANGITKLKFNITFLSQNEINDLKKSLNRVIKTNQETKEIIEREAYAQ